MAGLISLNKLTNTTKGSFSIHTDAKDRQIFERNGKRLSDSIDAVASQRRQIDLCFGKVLDCGLGLGVSVRMLVANPNVTEIIMVEKEQDVIDIVWSQIDFKGTIRKLIFGDIKKYLQETSEVFDSIYLDAWDEATADDYPFMQELKQIIVERKLCKSVNVHLWEEENALFQLQCRRDLAEIGVTND